MIYCYFPIYGYNNWLLVPLEGIEPPYAGCKPATLPLSYRGKDSGYDKVKMERVIGYDPTFLHWECNVIPIHYTRII